MKLIAIQEWLWIKHHRGSNTYLLSCSKVRAPVYYINGTKVKRGAFPLTILRAMTAEAKRLGWLKRTPRKHIEVDINKAREPNNWTRPDHTKLNGKKVM